MRVIIASDNKDKLNGVKKAFPNADIVSVQAKSYIGSVAFESALFMGAYNRIRFGVLEDYGIKDEDWDIIIGLQSGYVSKNQKYYITDACAILDKKGFLFANGPMFEISRILYEAAKQGVKLDKLVDEAPRNKGVTSVLEYISEGILNRSQATMLAVKEALNSNYADIGGRDFNYDSVIRFSNKNTQELIKKCCDINRDLIYYSALEK